MYRPTGAAFLLLGMTAYGLHAADAKSVLKPLQGTWRPQTGELAGKALAGNALKAIKLVISDDKYTVTVGEQVDRGTWKVNAVKKPKTMDIVGVEGPNKGKTFLAIYEITGDTLRICYDLSGKARPTEFKTTTGTMHFLITYQREKMP